MGKYDLLLKCFNYFTYKTSAGEIVVMNKKRKNAKGGIRRGIKSFYHPSFYPIWGVYHASRKRYRRKNF
jgi:hypothetical protein